MAANPTPAELPKITLGPADPDVLVVTVKTFTVTTEDGGQVTLYRGDRIKGDYYMTHLKGRPGIAVETQLDNAKMSDPMKARRDLVQARLVRVGKLPTHQTIQNRRSGGLPVYPNTIDAADVNRIALATKKSPDVRPATALQVTSEAATN